jgi:hypothetical protein
VSFIDAHRARFGVEPICRVLELAPSTYYARRSRLPSRRAVEDQQLLGRIRHVHAANYQAYGSRHTWKSLRRQGVEVGRGRVEPLMRRHGIQGAQRRAKRRWLTQADETAPRPADLVERRFAADAPTSFGSATSPTSRPAKASCSSPSKDVFSQRIVGWQTAEHLRTTSSSTRSKWRCTCAGPRTARLSRAPTAARNTPASATPSGSPTSASPACLRLGRSVVRAMRRRDRPVTPS